MDRTSSYMAGILSLLYAKACVVLDTSATFLSSTEWQVFLGVGGGILLIIRLHQDFGMPLLRFILRIFRRV